MRFGEPLESRRLLEAVHAGRLHAGEVAGLALCGELGAGRALEELRPGVLIDVTLRRDPNSSAWVEEWRQELATFLRAVTPGGIPAMGAATQGPVFELLRRVSTSPELQAASEELREILRPRPGLLPLGTTSLRGLSLSLSRALAMREPETVLDADGAEVLTPSEHVVSHSLRSLVHLAFLFSAEESDLERFGSASAHAFKALASVRWGLGLLGDDVDIVQLAVEGMVSRARSAVSFGA